MSDRTEYQREYMRNKRAKQREAKTTGQVATASTGKAVKAPTVCEDCNAKQLEQVRVIIRGELEALLTANTVSKLTPKLTTANTANNANNANNANRTCPHCGGNVTGPKIKIYCSNVCAKTASRSKSHHRGNVKRFDELWKVSTTI